MQGDPQAKDDPHLLDEVFAAYLKSVDLGQPAPLEEILARHQARALTLSGRSGERLEAHEAMPRFEGGAIAEQAAWLRRILARNLADAARDQRRHKRGIDRQQSLDQALDRSSLRLVTLLAAEASTPSARLQREESVLELADAVASLPPEQHEAVVLRHCMGWTLDEIARHTGKSDASVAGLLRRGLKALREKLGTRPGA